MEAKFFNYILQGHEATEENAYDAARGLDWSGIETQEGDYPYLQYVDTVNGVGIYYNYGSDDYYFTDETEEEKDPIQHYDVLGDLSGFGLNEKKDIVLKLGSIISEGTKNVSRRTILENEKKLLKKELSEMNIYDSPITSNNIKAFDVTSDEAEKFQEYKYRVKNELDANYKNTNREFQDSIDWLGVRFGDIKVSDVYGKDAVILIKDFTLDKLEKLEQFFDRKLEEYYPNLSESNNIMGEKEYEILESYLETALWTEEEEIGPANVNDFSDEARESANNDVLEFMNKTNGLIDELESSQVGHDLWLTRNGHGAGFWDRGLGELGDKLTIIAKSMGEKHLYRGDDEKIYFM